MASEKATRLSKPSTRSSLRHSLNFTSVGKALADVINKDARDRDGVLKKTKESSSRRLSLMSSTTLTRTTTSQKLKSPTPPHVGKEDSPSYKTITRRRQSTLLKHGTSSDEHGVKSTESVPSSPSRRSTLRSKTPSTISSALPKYRPRSAIVEPTKKPLSPVRVGARRRLSTSEEDDGERRDSLKDSGTPRSHADKIERPISPLPHRALAVKVNLPSPTTPSTPTKSKIAQPSPPKSSLSGSARPAKTVKTTVTSSPSRAPVTRPSSSASSSSSSQSHPSPSNPISLKNAFGFGRSKTSGQNSSPLRGTVRQPPESPLAHHMRQASIVNLGSNGKNTSAKALQNDEVNSEDSVEIDDVELLLAPVASLAAPTPAIPRIHTTTCQSTESELRTPSRPSSLLPTRANLSYLSPLPPSESSPALRPRGRSNDQDRGSILSWEQMATEGFQTIAREDLEGRLTDIMAPFTPGSFSPNAGTISLEVPETPNLSALPSPSGYGSISQVLLPDVTPSPAIHRLAAVFETSVDLPSPADSGSITLLRLQLAQAETIAKERLLRLQELEEQLYATKQCRIRETEELASQVSVLEQQLRTSVDTRERMDEERSAFTISLQDELRQAEARCDQAAQTGFERGQQAARLSLDVMLAEVQKNWEVSHVAKEVACLWSSVKEQADDEMNNMQSARQVLNVFMAVLDHNQEELQNLLA